MQHILLSKVLHRKNLTSSQTIFTSSHWQWFMRSVCYCVCFHFHTMESDVGVILNLSFVHGWLWLSDSLAITHSAHTIIVASTARCCRLNTMLVVFLFCHSRVGFILLIIKWFEENYVLITPNHVCHKMIVYYNLILMPQWNVLHSHHCKQ